MSGYDFVPHRVDARATEYHLHLDGAPVSWRETATALRRGADHSDPRGGAGSSDPGHRGGPTDPEHAVEPAAFASHFGTGTPVVSFPNLGGDARLVVPTPQPGTPAPTYAHLARFCRQAPVAQLAALWRAVGTEVLAWWAGTTAPLWLSTSGLGVGWLHVRLDSRPKYYSYQPFRALP